jgi:hypothetical protein
MLRSGNRSKGAETVITRRQALATGGLLGALVAGSDEGAAAQSPQGISDASVRDLTKAIDNVETAIVGPLPFTEIAAIRTRQVDFLRAQGRFPDFIEAGTDVWFAVYDWHVRHSQPTTLGRDSTGRYTLTLLFTTIVLRPDVAPSFIGVPG